MTNWVDYFEILEITHSAGQAEIEKSYIRLCKLFHPDINKAEGAEERMKLINVAFEVLGDARKRAQYIVEWKRKNLVARATAPASPAQPAAPAQRAAEPRYEQGGQLLAARRVLEQYFVALSGGDLKGAYGLLSDIDKKHIRLQSFMLWQKSVSEIYEIQKFSVVQSRHFERFYYDDDKSCKAERFAVEILEKNRKSGTSTQYVYTKFLIGEGERWRVYLGYRNLDNLITQMQSMYRSKESGVKRGSGPGFHVSGPLGMLYNYTGFVEQGMREAYRYKRYLRQFVVGVMQVEIVRENLGPQVSGQIIAHCATVIEKTLRVTDVLAYLAEGRFGMLLTEVGLPGVQLVAKRLKARLEREVWTCFDTKISCVFEYRCYAGEDINDTIDRCVAAVNPKWAAKGLS